ncbi:unnamed protein product [Thlaspi arvense]|uniref:ENT domain-containing protein n=1 Tax=Thlaspi arvense TaxID=13288 RepID=A0AAU9SEN8_THLAR|nr:unnamed protein product [Thlaspi arvense]
MSDKKDQSPDSPSKGSTVLPFKKRDTAEMTRAAETMSSGIDYDHLLAKNKKLKLDELQRKAYYQVLKAFTAESSAMSSRRITIIDKLKREWNIPYTTHTAFMDKIKQSREESNPSAYCYFSSVQFLSAEEVKVAAPQVEEEKTTAVEEEKMTAADEEKITAVDGNPLKPRLKLNDDDVVKFQEKLHVPPAKMQEEKAEPISTFEYSAIPSWGQVSPASLVDKWINIRIPGEDDYTAYLIAKYDAEREMHYLITAIAEDDLVDPCKWIDIRNFPAEDLVWQEGHPGFPTHKRCLNPGETILHLTSTAREKRRITEVGITDSGIPIIKKLDKGKGKA